jgi:hypothetical protein
VEAIGVVELPRLIVQAPGRAGDVTGGLTPPLLSSVASSGIEPTAAEPVVEPPRVTVETVPDAVPPPQDKADDVPVVFVAMPAPSKVEPDPLVPPPDIPLPLHGSVLAVGSNSIGLTPPGESSVAPSGMPTEPTDDVLPSVPSGDVAPIAGDVGVSGAIWAKLGPALNSNSSDPMAKIFRVSDHCKALRKSPAVRAFAAAMLMTCKSRIDISVFSGRTDRRRLPCRCTENTEPNASGH